MKKLMMASLTPAYNRDYKSKAAVLADFKAGKDFIMQPQGCYCSIRDFGIGATVILRYRSLRKRVVTEVTPEDFDHA